MCLPSLGLLDNNRSEDALDLFQTMKIPPNKYVLPVIFKICTQIGTSRSLQLGKTIFDTIPGPLKHDTIVSTSALHMYIKSGDMATSERLFSQMSKNLVTYAVMMGGRQPSAAR
jgi:hypothetical protein